VSKLRGTVGFLTKSWLAPCYGSIIYEEARQESRV
jgi:hypothetical protein